MLTDSGDSVASQVMRAEKAHLGDPMPLTGHISFPRGPGNLAPELIPRAHERRKVVFSVCDELKDSLDQKELFGLFDKITMAMPECWKGRVEITKEQNPNDTSYVLVWTIPPLPDVAGPISIAMLSAKPRPGAWYVKVTS